MAFTFIASARNDADAAGTTLDCTTSLNVAAGDVLVAWCKYEGTNATFAVAKNTGSPANTFTFDAGDEVNHTNNDLNASYGYVLSAAADATATFRLTTASKTFRGIIVLQFRPDAGDTVSKDTSAGGQGSSATPASGAITTAGTDEIAVGGYAQYMSLTVSSMQINGVAADGTIQNGTTSHWAWYRILTATFASGTASASTSASNDWICNVIAIKSVAAAGRTTKNTRSWNLGQNSGMGFTMPI